MPTKKTKNTDSLSSLRKKAETKLKKQDERVKKLSAQSSRELVHELGTHQIELEMQNEELRRTQTELEASRNKYFDLFDFSPVGYFTFDKSGLIAEVNLTGALLLGVERHFLINKPFSTFVHKDDRNAFRLYCATTLKEKTKQISSIRIIKKDKSVFYAQLDSIAVEGARDHASSVRTAFSDITERKQVEDAHAFLVQSGYTASGEDFFLALARYLARSLDMDYVCIDRLHGDLLSAETVAVYFDGKFEDNVSYTLKDTPCGDVVGRPVCCFPKDVRNLFPKDVVLQDMVAESYVGTTLWSSQGKPIGLIAVIGRKPLTDERIATSILQLVSVRAAGELERRQAEDALKAAHAELERRGYELDVVNRELEVYSFAISNDLKAPLRSIEGFTNAVLEDYHDKLDETGRDYLKRAHAASQRMTQLIEATLDMARLTRGELHEKTVDLGPLALGIAANLRKQHPEQQVEFIIAETMRAKGDPAMLQLMLQNLLDNAVKFSSKHPAAQIEVGVTDMDGHRVYFVRDNGEGFDMAYSDKLFKPFQRLHALSEFPGLGIGLAIAHRIIMRHNGRMWAEAAPKKGATFYFTL